MEPVRLRYVSARRSRDDIDRHYKRHSERDKSLFLALYARALTLWRQDATRGFENYQRALRACLVSAFSTERLRISHESCRRRRERVAYSQGA